jgi:hypothetical protein
MQTRLAMGVAAMVVMAAAVGAAEDRETQTNRVVVKVFNTAAVDDEVLTSARAIASEIYERAGVAISWETGDRKALRTIERTPMQAAAAGCPAVNRIDVKLGYIPRGERLGALAYARPFFRDGVRVTVATDRVTAYASKTATPVHVVLGWVLAHEIGHVLKGTDGHSERGLMRAQMHSGEESPEFYPPDLAVIRTNLKVAASAPASCGTLVAGRP